MNEFDKKDLDSLGEIFDAIGLGEALKDGAYGFAFNDEELTNSFKQAKLAAFNINRIYESLLDMED